MMNTKHPVSFHSAFRIHHFIMSSSPVTIYTVGHGRHPWADFLALLRKYKIELVCDVRSAARSRWPQFNGRVLAESLREAGIGYEWLPESGGEEPPPTEGFNPGVVPLIGPPAGPPGALRCPVFPPPPRS